MGHNGKHHHSSVEEVITNKVGSVEEVITDKVGSVVHSAEKFLGKTGDELKYQTEELNHNIYRYVKKNPYKTIGFAALAGAALTLFIRR